MAILHYRLWGHRVQGTSGSQLQAQVSTAWPPHLQGPVLPPLSPSPRLGALSSPILPPRTSSPASLCCFSFPPFQLVTLDPVTPTIRSCFVCQILTPLCGVLGLPHKGLPLGGGRAVEAWAPSGDSNDLRGESRSARPEQERPGQPSGRITPVQGGPARPAQAGGQIIAADRVGASATAALT